MADFDIKAIIKIVGYNNVPADDLDQAKERVKKEVEEYFTFLTLKNLPLVQKHIEVETLGEDEGDEIIKLAIKALQKTEEQTAADSSCSLMYDGRRYCVECGQYEHGGDIIHDDDCAHVLRQNALSKLKGLIG